MVLAAAFGIYAWALASGSSPDAARAMTLPTAMVVDLFLVVSDASRQSVFVAGRALRLPSLFLPIVASRRAMAASAAPLAALKARRNITPFSHLLLPMARAGS